MEPLPRHRSAYTCELDDNRWLLLLSRSPTLMNVYAILHHHGLDSLLKIIAATEKELLEIDGIKGKSAKRIVTNIHEGLQDITVPLIIGSSGVLGESIGSKKTDALFRDLPNVLELSSKDSHRSLKKKILAIEGFSEITTDKIVERLKYAKSLLEQMTKYCTFKQQMRV